jgi:hypothetical protein
MTNKEKLIAIIGEENFRKLERNFKKTKRNIDSFIEKEGKYSLLWAFGWDCSIEGYRHWYRLNLKLMNEWETVDNRLISPEEQELLFKMFVMEWMEYLQGNNEEWYEFCLGQGLGLKIYEALRSE